MIIQYNRDRIIIFLLIIIISLIPVFWTYGFIGIEGDVIIPFSSTSLEKYFYQWLPINNGQYISLNYAPLYIFYKVFETFNLTIYTISSSLLFLLSFVSGVGIYKLCKLIYPGINLYLIVPISFYLLSPAFLNGGHYLYIYSLIPWFVYFTFRIIDKKKLDYIDIIFLNLVLFFSSLDLPNVKYIFHLFLIMIIIVALSLILHKISFKHLYESKWKILLLILSLSYLWIPLVAFVLDYSPEKYDIHVKKGYIDEGPMMDFGSTLLNKMVRLHHDTINLNQEARLKYNSNKLISSAGFIFILIILIGFLYGNSTSFKKNKNQFKISIFLLLLCVYLFFAVGPNPPFGFIYEYLVKNFYYFAFLRTTAGAVFFLSMIYAVLLYVTVINVKTKKMKYLIVLVFVASLVLVSYPMINGEFYKNMGNINRFTNKSDYGQKIPPQYFEVIDTINSKRLDYKLYLPKMDLGYFTTNWGYFGPTSFYEFFYTSNNIGSKQVYSNLANHNIRYVLLDYSVLSNTNFDISLTNKTIYRSDNKLVVDLVNSGTFLPHFYIPVEIIISNGSVSDLPNIFHRQDYILNSVVFLEEQNWNKINKTLKISNNSKTRPIIEFTKINPTKYRIVVHKMNGKFPLVFSEQFHDFWKVYLVEYKSSSITHSLSLLNKYKILEGNELDQATKNDVKQFIENGWISSLGDGKENKIKNINWDLGKRNYFIEKYSVDFISKNFYDTIQNNNLRQGTFYETWFKDIVGDNDHLVANGYANSWILDPQQICDKNINKCIKNPDDTYDFELIIEFLPQRYFLVGVYISSIILLLCIIRLIHRTTI